MTSTAHGRSATSGLVAAFNPVGDVVIVRNSGESSLLNYYSTS
jgi:hypothetical protein